MKLTEKQKLYQQVINEAWNNAAFKKKLINDPVKTIEALTGKPLNLPEGKTLVVRDQTDETTLYINIPAQINMDDVELNEEELEHVAGGGTLPNVIW